MDLFLYFFFDNILGGFIRLFFRIDRAEKAEKDLAAVKLVVADLIKGRETELVDLSDDIVTAFKRHGFRVIERSDSEIRFRHRLEQNESVTMRLR